MMIVRVCRDELYPFYFYTMLDWTGEERDIPPEKIDWIERVMEEFDDVQRYLEKVYKHTE